MFIKIVIGAVVGACIGFGLNYVCMLTGGACPLMNNRIVAIVLWVFIGGTVGAMMAGR